MVVNNNSQQSSPKNSRGKSSLIYKTKNQALSQKKHNIRWQLVLYDIVIYLLLGIFLLVIFKNNENISFNGSLIQSVITFICIFTARIIGKIYQQIWRYGGIQCYVRLLFVDGCAFAVNLILEKVLPIEHITFSHLLGIACVNLLGALSIRMLYRYAYKCSNSYTTYGKFLKLLLRVFAGIKIDIESRKDSQKIKIAIIGAGRTGVSLSEELLANTSAMYIPICFVDVNKEKVNRSIHGIPVLMENDNIFYELKNIGVQEIVFAIQNLDADKKKDLYQRYLNAGYKLKVYDYPEMHTEGGKRHMREFDIEELLFRKPVILHDEKTKDYYKNKIIMITGGGGSIGSELCRQIAKMQPKKIIILDIYENGSYDIQQELKITYGNNLNIKVEIVSITNRQGMVRVFTAHKPQIVIHAAAHKHVPLMEENCIEAVENNVFGTKILVDLCEEFKTERFMMVSTDKAVNPTNVMGATKRLCEMIVQSASTYGDVKYSATRFGNVLGSAGSVIPLFKKQIANGGPITITDKRIIRYFMTISEASQLVLQSGAMAKNGELFVLDMGNPVKILDLAKTMIQLSGVHDIEIVETGLRPGEKLYEELLVKTEELEKTDNSMIFIERDTPYEKDIIDVKLKLLKEACLSGNNEEVRLTLKKAVPTYKEPKEVNATAESSEEMNCVKELVMV